MKTPLRHKILFYSSALLIVLIVTMLVFVNFLAERFVNERIVNDIEEGRTRISQADQERIGMLKLTAGLVASLPGLKAALSTDTGTVRDFLSYYQQQHTAAQLLIVLDEAGRVVARTDSPEAAPVPPELDAGILSTAQGVYHVAKAPAEAGGSVFGYVL